MVREVVTLMTDDLDGDEIADGEGGTVRLAIDGEHYEIDLRHDNRQALMDALAPFIVQARRGTTRAAPSGDPSGRPTYGHSAREVRTWARQNGMDVPDRGRIPGSVLDAFNSSR